MRIGLVDLAGMAATRTGALPSHNLKPERYVQSAWASGGQRADADKKAPGPSSLARQIGRKMASTEWKAPGAGAGDRYGRQELLKESESAHQSSRAFVGSGLQVRDRQCAGPGGQAASCRCATETSKIFSVSTGQRRPAD